MPAKRLGLRVAETTAAVATPEPDRDCNRVVRVSARWAGLSGCWPSGRARAQGRRVSPATAAYWVYSPQFRVTGAIKKVLNRSGCKLLFGPHESHV